MKTLALRLVACLSMTLAATSALAADAAPVGPAAPCTAQGNVNFVCGMRNPEDLVAVPGTPWIIVSGMAAVAPGDTGPASGELYLIDSRDRKWQSISRESLAQPQKDAKNFARCPGPPDAKVFAAHGLALRAGSGAGPHTLYAVDHGGRESIEAFRVDAGGAVPKLTWIGCAVLDDKKAWLNSLAPLPDGGLVVTSMYDPTDPQAFVSLGQGKNKGIVFEWQPASGFQRIAGSELDGDNGIEVSADGKWLFVNAWVGQQVIRMSRTAAATGRTTLPVKFMPDNIRRAPDGTLLITGQNETIKNINACRAGAGGVNCDKPVGTTVLRLDTQAMTLKPVVELPGTNAFNNGTTALQIGDQLWIGTFRGDRVAIVPAR